MVPRGTAGELLTRGYSVMRGYWDDPQQTAEAIDEAGWMHTGDLATIDQEGYCNIVGRIKDMVVRGGENIYPREVEEFLFRHAKIEAAQVVGVPDSKYGEELCAWIKLRNGETMTEQEVRDFCQGQIAHYKVPRYVCFVSEFPMTVTGKVQKFVIRQQMMERLGLTDLADVPAGSLAQGDERRLGVARALVTEPDFVLMDEPAAGLPEAEVPEFAEVVRSVRDEYLAGVLLIDHNMALVMGVCDRIHVLDQGRTLAAGTPEEIRGDLDVAAAYLGESAVDTDA